ncbi:hypothetical protein FNV43_RR19010 [Rhamnella rubrinervis]|uniref:Dehydrin n=1 Tax=Rhamnella rubrinervis TaxID=2594499 RepID=A0A8K0GW51_9ROSA|nr:hypothetical protein FNV43_RR19010 [Rhamnella rubrinervis]
MAHIQNPYGATGQTDEYGNPISQTDEYGNPIQHTGITGSHGTTGYGTTGYGTGTAVTGVGGEHNQQFKEHGHGTGVLHRSGSGSSSSSEDDGQGGRRKKGLKEKIKEKMPGQGHRDDQGHVSATTTPVGYDAMGEHHEKKGMMDKIKEKLPGRHSKRRVTVEVEMGRNHMIICSDVYVKHLSGTKHQKNLEQLNQLTNYPNAAASTGSSAATVPLVGPPEKPEASKGKRADTPQPWQQAAQSQAAEEDLETKRRKNVEGGATLPLSYM